MQREAKQWQQNFVPMLCLCSCLRSCVGRRTVVDVRDTGVAEGDVRRGEVELERSDRESVSCRKVCSRARSGSPGPRTCCVREVKELGTHA